MFEEFYFVPLEVPKLELNREKFLDYFDTHKEHCVDDVSAPLDHPWNIVWAKPRNSDWTNDIKKLFPQIIEAVENLPFYEINNIAFLEQNSEVKLHSDVSKESDPLLGPSTYRCMLINDERETFYLREGIRIEGTLKDEIHFPEFPEDKNFFCVNNYRSMHGAFIAKCPNSRKIIMAIWGKVIPEQHLKLIDKSITFNHKYCLQVTPDNYEVKKTNFKVDLDRLQNRV